MNPITSIRLATCAAWRWKGVAWAATITVACIFGPPALAQSPNAASSPIVAASAAVTVEPPVAMNVQVGGASTTNPYGLRVVWAQGDLVARTTLVLLTLMSLLSWYFIVAKWLEQRSQALHAQLARAAFANADSLQKGASALGKDSPFRVLVDSAMDALRKYESLAGQVEVGTWLSQDIVRNISTLQMRMQSGLSVLATVGSTAPFVGLFGTVWGIYNALVTIGSTGQASIDKVAGPVGEALIMTALGLAVAVPAVLGYNWLVRRNRVALHSAKGFGSDLHTLLLVEIEKSQRAAKTAKAHD
jgi:biopolymer transport protein ExbB